MQSNSAVERSQAKASKQREPFVMIPVSLRERLHELSPIELPVWLYYRLRAGKNGIAFASAETLQQDLGMCRDTVCKARASLVRKGWLVFREQSFGGVQKFQVVIPTAVPVVGREPTSDESRRLMGSGTSRRTGADASRRMASDTEVYTGVDTGLDKPSAPQTGALLPLAEPDLPEWLPMDAWDAYLKMRKGKRGAKVTPEAVALLIKKLDGMRQDGQNVREVLEQSVMSSWTGLFPVKEQSTNGQTRKQHCDVEANYRAIYGTSKPN